MKREVQTDGFEVHWRESAPLYLCSGRGRGRDNPEAWKSLGDPSLGESVFSGGGRGRGTSKTGDPTVVQDEPEG